MPREQITHNRIVDRAVDAQTFGSSESVPVAIAQEEIERRNLHV